MRKPLLSFSFRPPVDVLDALERRAVVTGKGRSAIVIEALRHYLDQPKPDGTLTPTVLSCLTDRLDSLEAEFRAHLERRSEVQDGHQDRETSEGCHLHERVSPGGSIVSLTTCVAPARDLELANEGVTSVDEAIVALEQALVSIRPNNAGAGQRGIKRVLPFFRNTKVLPETLRGRVLGVLEPCEPFHRTKGGRVKAAIRETLVILQTSQAIVEGTRTNMGANSQNDGPTLETQFAASATSLAEECHQA